MTNLADNITKLMLENGWNGKTLAEKSDQKISAIYNILNGRSQKPSGEKVEAIARAFNVSTSSLLYGPVEKPQNIADDNWDGLLYSDSMNLVRKICERRKIKFSDRNEEREQIMKFTMRVYNYAIKRNEITPDSIFAEDIIAAME